MSTCPTCGNMQIHVHGHTGTQRRVCTWHTGTHMRTQRHMLNVWAHADTHTWTHMHTRAWRPHGHIRAHMPVYGHTQNMSACMHTHVCVHTGTRAGALCAYDTHMSTHIHEHRNTQAHRYAHTRAHMCAQTDTLRTHTLVHAHTEPCTGTFWELARVVGPQGLR